MRASVVAPQQRRRATIACPVRTPCSTESLPLTAAQRHLGFLVSVLEPRTIPSTPALVSVEPSSYRQVLGVLEDRMADQLQPLPLRRPRPCVANSCIERSLVTYTAVVSDSAAVAGNVTETPWPNRTTSDREAIGQTKLETAARR